MKISKKIILAVFLFVLTSAFHPFYVSICQIDYNAQNHSLEISVKIFADDLLIALENQGFTDLHLGEEQENKNTNEYISNYLKEKISIKTDGKTRDFTFLGKEMEDNAIWCYLEITDVNTLNKIEVTDRILTEIYNDQDNVVQVNKNGKILNLLLKKNKIKGELNFE